MCFFIGHTTKHSYYSLFVGITIGLELLLYSTNEGYPVTVCAAVRSGNIARIVHFTMQALGGNASRKKY